MSELNHQEHQERQDREGEKSLFFASLVPLVVQFPFGIRAVPS